MTHKSTSMMEQEWTSLRLDVVGKTVLDVGCHDGWFSFRAGQEGASRVVGVDLWDGRRGNCREVFELTCPSDSKVEPIQADFMTTDLEVFDVVLFMGVLYHLEEPFTALRRLRRVTGELAVIETVAIPGPGMLCRFLPGAELNDDPTNWWMPTKEALVGMCQAAGFSKCDVVDERHQRGGYCRITAFARP